MSFPMKLGTTQNIPRIPLANFKQRLIAATGISEKMYRKISKDSEKVNSQLDPHFLHHQKENHLKIPQMFFVLVNCLAFETSFITSMSLRKEDHL
jgi:hypothetical protein